LKPAGLTFDIYWGDFVDPVTLWVAVLVMYLLQPYVCLATISFFSPQEHSSTYLLLKTILFSVHGNRVYYQYQIFTSSFNSPLILGMGGKRLLAVLLLLQSLQVNSQSDISQNNFFSFKYIHHLAKISSRNTSTAAKLLEIEQTGSHL